MRFLRPRRHRRRYLLAGGVLLAAAAVLTAAPFFDDEGRRSEHAAPQPAPPVQAPMVVYAALKPGTDVAAVARGAGVDPATIRPTSFGFFRFTLPDGVSVDELEQRLRASPGVISANRDRTEDVVLQ